MIASPDRRTPGDPMRKGIFSTLRIRLALSGVTGELARVAHAKRCHAVSCRHIQLFVLLMLANCTSNDGNGEPASVENDIHSSELTAGFHCQASQGLHECLSRNERTAAEKYGVELTRKGGEICLSSPAATDVCLRDKAGLRHVFLERIQGYFVVVEIEDMEGYTVLMVSEKTGRQRRVDNRPLFSPGAPYFATVSYDTDAGYLQNRVAIWNSTTNALLYKVDRFASGTGPVGIRWATPTRLKVHYSRTEYSPARDENTGTFSIWREEKNTWSDDYTR